MKRRWRITAIVALAVPTLAIMGTLLFLQMKNAWVAERLAVYLTRELLAKRGYELELGGFGGSAFGSLEARDILVRYKGPGSEPFVFFQAERMKVRYDLFSLLLGRYHASDLELRDGTLRLRPIDKEGWAYPGFDRLPGKRDLGEMKLDHIRLSDLLIVRGEGAAADSIQVAETAFSLYRNVVGTTINLTDFTAQWASRGAIENLRGRVVLRDGDVLLSGLKVVLPSSKLDLTGAINPAEGGLRLHLRAHPLAFAEVSRLLGKPLQTDSHLTGDLRVETAGDGLAARGRISGPIYGYRLEDMDLDLTLRDGTLHCDSLAGRVNGSGFDGWARFCLPLDGNAFSVDLETALSGFDLAVFRGGGLRTDLNGKLRLKRDHSGSNFHLDLTESQVDDWLFGSGRGDLVYRADTLWFESLHLADRGLEVRLQGDLVPASGSMDLEASGRSLSSDLAARLSRDEELLGDFSFSTRLKGSWPHPALEFDGCFADARYFETAMSTGNLVIRSDSLGVAPLQIHLDGGSFRRGQLAGNAFFLDGSLDSGRFQIRHASFDRPEGSLILAGEAFSGKDALCLRLDRAWLDWQGTQWLNDRGFDLCLGENAELGPVAFHSSRGEVRLHWHDGQGELLRTRGLDIGLLSAWSPFFSGYGGNLDALVRRQEDGFVLDLSVDALRFGQEDVGELQLKGWWRADSLQVGSLDWRMSDATLKLAGSVSGLPPALGGPSALGELDVGNLAADLRLDAASFPLATMLSPFTDSLPVGGRLGGTVHASGPLTAPVWESVAALDSCLLKGLFFDRLEWSLHSVEDGLAASRVSLRRGQSLLTGHGQVPLVLTLTEKPRLVPDRNLSGRLKLAKGRGEDLLGLTSRLAEASGRIDLDLALGGSVDHLAPVGEITIRDGGFRLSGWEERFSDLSATIAVRGDTLRLLSCAAREGLQYSRGRRGAVSASGWTTWQHPVRYQLQGHCEKLAVGTLPFFEGHLGGDVTFCNLDEEGRIRPPILAGDFRIDDGVLSGLFESRSDDAGPGWLQYRLALHSDGQLHFRSDEADLELAGDIELNSSPDGLDLTGELRTLRGHYMLFGNRFQLREGKLDFSSAQGINPGIDILAETWNRDDRIAIRISNTLAEPDVSVESEQGYSEEDIFRILAGLPVGQDQTGMDLAQTVVRGQVEAELLSRLERAVAGELSGIVDRFEIESRVGESGADAETRWQVGRYLPGGFYLTYNQGLSLDSDREVGLEYRLGDRFVLRSQIVNRGMLQEEEGLINDYSVDVRFRYEY